MQRPTFGTVSDEPPAATDAPRAGSDVPAPKRAGGASSFVAALHHPRLARVAAIVVWCWPALVVTSPYLTWLVAWAVLGRRPRPSLDDPKSISTLVDVQYFVSLLLLMTLPAAGICGLSAIVWSDRTRGALTVGTCARCVLFLLAWIAAILLLGWDPLEVMYWFMD